MSFWDSLVMELLSSQNLMCMCPVCCAIPKQNTHNISGCVCTCTGSQHTAVSPHAACVPLDMPVPHPLPPGSSSLTMPAQPPVSHWQQHVGNAKTIIWLHLLWVLRMPEIDSLTMLCNIASQLPTCTWKEKGVLLWDCSSSDLAQRVGICHCWGCTDVMMYFQSRALQKLLQSEISYFSFSL